jgi:hypothetical protein
MTKFGRMLPPTNNLFIKTGLIFMKYHLWNWQCYSSWFLFFC